MEISNGVIKLLKRRNGFAKWLRIWEREEVCGKIN